jgi:hypothetical protein
MLLFTKSWLNEYKQEDCVFAHVEWTLFCSIYTYCSFGQESIIFTEPPYVDAIKFYGPIQTSYLFEPNLLAFKDTAETENST